MPTYHYHRINDLERHPKLNDMVFGAIWCGESKPYEYHMEVPKENRGKKIPLVLMHLRWDGFIGFPGGKVDSGEDLIDALAREMKEEYNFNMSDRAVHLCSHADDHGELHTHCYEIGVNEADLKEIIMSATKAEHFMSETQGVFAVQIAEFFSNRGYSQFRKNNFKATAGIQLDTLVKKHNWLPLRG